MCGIAGIVTSEDRGLHDIFAMTSSQAHRGPDGEAYLTVSRGEATFGRSQQELGQRLVGNLAFGHRRLAILDVTDAGLQPMASPDGSMWIAHNGEIYNFVELRQSLQRLGHCFRTGTDTEVALAAYAQWGTECFSRFNGMWGMAIWDGRQARLVLSRDRLGVKPLHVHRGPTRLLFGSEIKSILAASGVSRRVDRASVAEFLRWGKVNASNATMFDGIESFPAGHFAVIDPARPHAWSPEAFWSIDSSPSSRQVSFNAAAEGFKELFTSSIELQMRSDVPVGSCLSGGLDSSAVVCAATESNQTVLNTFTSVIDGYEHDERGWAAIVNEHVGAQSHLVRPTAAGFAEEHAKLMWHQEEPYLGTSIYAQWTIMRAARAAEVPVLLDGQGGDEAMCGYRKYYFFYLQSLLRQRRALRALREGVALLRNGDGGQWNLQQGRSYLPGPLRARVWDLASVLQPTFVDDWERSEAGLGLGSSIGARQIADLRHFSVPALLRYEDRNSMAWSVEARVPLLDHRLVEYLVGLPVETKLRDGRTKDVMRQGLRGLVPDAVLDRRTKLGFNTPMAQWMATDLRSFFERRFARADFAAAEIVNPTAVQRAFERHAPAQEFSPLRQLFQVYALDAWMEQFEVSV